MIEQTILYIMTFVKLNKSHFSKDYMSPQTLKIPLYMGRQTPIESTHKFLT